MIPICLIPAEGAFVPVAGEGFDFGLSWLIAPYYFKFYFLGTNHHTKSFVFQTSILISLSIHPG
jgi:hypothetical protein